MEIIDIKNELQANITAYIAGLPPAIIDDETYLIYTNEGRNIKSQIATIEETIKPGKSLARAAWQAWVDMENDLKAKITAKETYIKGELVRYRKVQADIRAAEEARLREIARKEEEERQLMDAIQAEESGEKEEADAILDAPVAPVVVIAPKNVPKAEGVSFTTSWKFRIVNENLIDRKYMMPNEKAIGSVVNSLGPKADIAGVEVYSVETVSIKKQRAAA